MTIKFMLLISSCLGLGMSVGAVHELTRTSWRMLDGKTHGSHATLYTECGGYGCEHCDDEVDDGLECFFLHLSEVFL